MVATEWVMDVRPELKSIAPTRRAVRERLARCGVVDTADAELMVSELVGNAILHAATPIRVAVRCTEEKALVEVQDGSSVMPEARGHEPMRPGGHGLRIVDALSVRWGVRPCDTGGKIVWFEVTPSTPAPGA